MQWLKQKKGTNLRPEPFSTHIRQGGHEALKRYATEEGVKVSDIIDTKLMRDLTFRKHLTAVQKELHDRESKEVSSEGSEEKPGRASRAA
jgi:hypothetical protein